MTFDAIILPDGSTARLFATYDENGERVGGVARDASGYTHVLDAKNTILTQYRATPFYSGTNVSGELRCDASRDCYTVNAKGEPILSVDSNGRVNRVIKFVDQNGRERRIEDFDPKKGDVIVQTIAAQDSAFSATNSTISVRTAETIEAQMRAMFGLNLYMGGGELNAISPSVLDACKNTTSCNYVDFVFDIVAPATPGTYRFQWQMQNGTTWFGQASGAREITVTAPQPAPFAVVDALNYGPIAKRGSFISLFGAGIAQTTATVDDPQSDCSLNLGGRTVDIFRVDGSEWSVGCLTYVSPGQVNVRLPNVAVGNYLIVLGDEAGDYVATSPVVWVGN